MTESTETRAKKLWEANFNDKFLNELREKATKYDGAVVSLGNDWIKSFLLQLRYILTIHSKIALDSKHLKTPTKVPGMLFTLQFLNNNDRGGEKGIKAYNTLVRKMGIDAVLKFKKNLDILLELYKKDGNIEDNISILNASDYEKRYWNVRYGNFVRYLQSFCNIPFFDEEIKKVEKDKYNEPRTKIKDFTGKIIEENGVKGITGDDFRSQLNNITVKLPDAIQKSIKRDGNDGEGQKIIDFINERIATTANNAVYFNLTQPVDPSAKLVHTTDTHADKCDPISVAKKSGIVTRVKTTPAYYDEVSKVFYTQDEFEENIEILVPKGMTLDAFRSRFTLIEDFEVPDKLPETVMLHTGDIVDRGPEGRECLLILKRLEELTENNKKDGDRPSIVTVRGNHVNPATILDYTKKGRPEAVVEDTLDRMRDGRCSLVEVLEFSGAKGNFYVGATHSCMDMNIITYMLTLALMPYNELMVENLCTERAQALITKEECDRLRMSFKDFVDEARKDNKYKEFVELYDKVKNNILRYATTEDNRGNEEERLREASDTIIRVFTDNAFSNQQKLSFLGRCMGVTSEDPKCLIVTDKVDIQSKYPKVGADTLTALQSVGLYNGVCETIRQMENPKDISTFSKTYFSQFVT